MGAVEKYMLDELVVGELILSGKMFTDVKISSYSL